MNNINDISFSLGSLYNEMEQADYLDCYSEAPSFFPSALALLSAGLAEFCCRIIIQKQLTQKLLLKIMASLVFNRYTAMTRYFVEDAAMAAGNLPLGLFVCYFQARSTHGPHLGFQKT